MNFKRWNNRQKMYFYVFWRHLTGQPWLRYQTNRVTIELLDFVSLFAQNNCKGNKWQTLATMLCMVIVVVEVHLFLFKAETKQRQTAQVQRDTDIECWLILMLINADWHWLMLIDTDIVWYWCRLTLIDVDWYWLILMQINADWYWYWN